MSLLSAQIPAQDFLLSHNELVMSSLLTRQFLAAVAAADKAQRFCASAVSAAQSAHAAAEAAQRSAEQAEHVLSRMQAMIILQARANGDAGAEATAAIAELAGPDEDVAAEGYGEEGASPGHEVNDQEGANPDREVEGANPDDEEPMQPRQVRRRIG